MKKIITTAAYPFIPAELLLAHVASTYLPADIYHRFMKLSGHQSYLVCATDVHGIWIKHESLRTNESVDLLVERWHEKYQKQFSDLHIYFDIYSRTDTESLHRLVNHSLFKLRDDGLIAQRDTDNYYCKSCHEALPKRFRLKSVNQSNTGKSRVDEKILECGFCNSNDIESSVSKHYFMKLNDGINDINDFIEKQQLPHVRSTLSSFVRKELNEWDFTRDSNYYGLRLPFEGADQRLYLWYDSLLCYITLIPDHLNVHEINFRHFIGKNILYYHGIVWPFLLKNVFPNLPDDVQVSARGFLNIERTSVELLKIDDALKSFSPDFIRFYLAYKTPDSMSDYYFDTTEMKGIINSILCNQIGSFFQRCLGIFQQFELTHVPAAKFPSDLWDETLREITKLFETTKTRSALLAIQKYLKSCGQCINSLEIYREFDPAKLGLLAELMAGALLLLSVYMPESIKDFDCFNLDFKSFNETETLAGREIISIVSRWEPIL